jgi:hypothetical protein
MQWQRFSRVNRYCMRGDNRFTSGIRTQLPLPLYEHDGGGRTYLTQCSMGEAR